MSNGQLAVDTFKRLSEKEDERYCLIITDISMPIKDGYEATKEIRHYCSVNKIVQPYIIAITGHCEQRYVEHAWSC